MAQKDYYKILGVGDSAPADEIKRAYRLLAKKHHPDANPTDKKNAEEKFKEISEAYYVLGDVKRRAEYDDYRRSGFSPGQASRGPSGQYQGAQGFDFDEILRMFRQAQTGQGAPRGSSRGRTGSFEDIFAGSGFFSSQSREQDDDDYLQDVASDVQAVLKLSRHRAQKGGEVTFHTRDGRKITVKIPAGVTSGKRLRLARQGNLCASCHHPGDLILTLKVD